MDYMPSSLHFLQTKRMGQPSCWDWHVLTSSVAKPTWLVKGGMECQSGTNSSNQGWCQQPSIFNAQRCLGLLPLICGPCIHALIKCLTTPQRSAGTRLLSLMEMRVAKDRKVSSNSCSVISFYFLLVFSSSVPTFCHPFILVSSVLLLM